MSELKSVWRRVLPSYLKSGFRSLVRRARQFEFESKASREIQNYFSSSSEAKTLHLGCGPYPILGWLNLDYVEHTKGVVFCDLTKKLPIPDESLDAVFSEHFIEHISFQDGSRLLTECFRCLKPGGVLRIVTPDLSFLWRLYAEPDLVLHQRYREYTATRWQECAGAGSAFVVNHFFHAWGHRFLYDWPTLERALIDAGFADVIRGLPEESSNPLFRGVDRHHLAISSEFNELESLAVEARRSE